MNKNKKLIIKGKQNIHPAIAAPVLFPKRLYPTIQANWIVIALFLGCFLVFNTYTYLRMSGDTLPAQYLPFSIIFYHDLFFEHFFNPAFIQDAYAVTMVNGHLMSIFPIVTPVLVTPFFWLCTWGMTPDHAVIYIGAIARTASAGIAALAVVMFYLVVIRFVQKKSPSSPR